MQQHHFLHFSKGERRGVITLVVLIVLVRLLPYVYEIWFAPFPQMPEVQITALEPDTSFTANRYEESKRKESEFKTQKKAKRFYFDPNELSQSGFEELGLNTYLAQRIVRYREKGGRFYKADDLFRIYGMDSSMANSLLPWVQIRKAAHQPEKISRPAPVQYSRIDINTADSAAWESLPGIGPKLAARIITFREKLGGFYSIDQIGETYGLADSVFLKFKNRLQRGPYALRKMNINNADKETLQAHPYIRYKLAALIIAYRNQHGNFEKISDLEKIPGCDTALLKKLEPYLNFSP